MKRKTNLYFRKTVALLPAVVLLALGISVSLAAELGADLYTSFQEGLAKGVGVDVGTMNTIFNICIIAVFLMFNRKLINIGSIIMSVFVGPCMTLFGNILSNILTDIQLSLIVRIFITCIGAIFISLALSWYILLDVGVQPLDMIIMTIAKAIKKSYGIGMYAFNVLMLIGCLLIGATIGIGTIINFLFIGRLVDLIMPRMKPIVIKIISKGELL